MRKKFSKYFNIYFVIAFIGGFSMLYMLSFALVLNDINNGSSRAIKKKLCENDPKICYVEPRGHQHKQKDSVQ